MAILTAVHADEMARQTLRSTKRIEHVKVVANNSATTDGTTYNFKRVKNVVGVIDSGPFAVTINNTTKVATITPVATVSAGTYFIGLVEG